MVLYIYIIEEFFLDISYDNLKIEVLPGSNASIALDGHIVTRLEVGQSLSCTAAEKPARLVSFGSNNFHRVLKEKFGLSDR